MDLIYRQQAIDAFKKELTTGEPKGKYVTICSAVSFEGAKQILEALPAVQPQEIIRCKDCRYYKAYDYTGYLACHLVVGGTARRDLDDFCSRAERRNDE